ERAATFDCVVATIFHSVVLLSMILEKQPGILPAYYVQDYEPWFFERGSEPRREAEESYTLVPEALLLAKTDWLAATVDQHHGVQVEKIEPSLDREVFHARGRGRWSPVRVAAMIRPSTRHRGAERTLRVLRRLKDEVGDD